MEFLNGLGVARKQHGLTQEEFMEIWEMEAKITLMSKEASKMVDTEQTISKDGLDSTTTDSFKEYIDKMTTDMREIKQSLDQKLNDLNHKLLEINENLISIRKQTVTEREFRSEIQSLKNHLLRTTDSHSSSLKSFFTQELQALGQKLEQKLICMDSVKSYFAQELRCLKKDLETRLENLQNSREEYKTDCKQLLDTAIKSPRFAESFPQLPEKLNRECQDRLKQSQKTQLPDTSRQHGMSQQIQNQSVQHQQEIQEKNQEQHEGEEAQRIRSIDSIKNRPLQHEDAGTNQKSNTDAETVAAKRTTAATGLQMKQKDTSAVGQQHKQDTTFEVTTYMSSKASSYASFSFPADTLSEDESTSHLTIKTSWASVSPEITEPFSLSNSVETQKNTTFPVMPQEGAYFQIENAKDFASSGRDFFTGYFHTRHAPTKTRLRLKFDDKGCLRVHFLVSASDFDAQVAWPLVLSGTGYIFHTGSKDFKKLWTLAPEKCARPDEEKEIELRAVVCMCTSSGIFRDVRFEDLVERLYEDQGVLSFKWDVSAESLEDPGGPEARWLGPSARWLWLGPTVRW